MRKVLVTLLAVVLMVGMLMSGCAKETVPTEPISPTGPSPTTIEPPTSPTAPTVPTTPTTPTVTPPTTPAGEPVYSVLDPRSSEPAIEFVGLSPRLDTLVGKKIGVANQHGGNEQIIETIATKLQALVPEADVVYYSSLGKYDKLKGADWEFIESCDAVVLCHAY